MQRNSGEKRFPTVYGFGIIIGFWTVLIFTADLFIKQFLRDHYAWTSTPIIPGIFNLNIVFNTGAAFSILYGHTDWLIYAGAVFLILFFFLAAKEPRKTSLAAVAYGFIAGGALNNFYDRIVFGFVVDYLDFKIWPVFNLSDTAICAGVGLLLIASIKNRSR